MIKQKSIELVKYIYEHSIGLYSFVIIHFARLQLSKALACDKRQRCTLVPRYRQDRHTYVYYIYLYILFIVVFEILVDDAIIGLLLPAITFPAPSQSILHEITKSSQCVYYMVCYICKYIIYIVLLFYKNARPRNALSMLC